MSIALAVCLIIAAVVVLPFSRRRKRAHKSEMLSIKPAAECGASAAFTLPVGTSIGQNDIAALSGLMRELDINMMQLRRLVHNCAFFAAGHLTTAQIASVEERLGYSLFSRAIMNVSSLEIVACDLEQAFADCQLLCAFIECALIENGDSSVRMVKDALADLALALSWMETASIVLRAIPLGQRFARVTSMR